MILILFEYWRNDHFMVVGQNLVNSLLPSAEPTTLSSSFEPSVENEYNMPISELHSSHPFLYHPLKSLAPFSVSSAENLLSFDVSQDIEHCTGMKFYTDNGAELAFRHTVSEVMTGISYQNVTISVVEDTPSIFRNRKLLPSGITVDYKVSFDVRQAGYANITIGYMICASELEDSIEDGVFTSILQQKAKEFNSTCLRTAEASIDRLRISSPFFRHARSPVISPTRLPTEPLDDGELMIAEAEDVGIGVVLAVVCSAAVFFSFSAFLIRKRVGWRYFKGRTTDTEAEADEQMLRETELANGIGGNDETVVWFQEDDESAPQTRN